MVVNGILAKRIGNSCFFGRGNRRGREGNGQEDDSLLIMIYTAAGRRKRTRVAKKRAAGKVSTVLLRASADQGENLGNGSPEKEQPEAPDTFSTGKSFGELKIKKEKVYRQVERCCPCTRLSTCHRTYECKETGSACTNCMCFLQ